MGNYRKYDEGFKQSLVNLYHGGKPQSALAKEYGVSTSALAKWIKQYSEVQMDDDTVLTAKQNLRALEEKCASRRGESHIKKSHCHIHAPLKERLRAVHILRFQHCISTLCRVLKVNRSTYYKYIRAKPSARALEN